MSANLTSSQSLFTSQSVLAARKAESQYGILLHALQHEDNVSYVDRHILVLEKWIRENVEG
jgi:hypothetical protein